MLSKSKDKIRFLVKGIDHSYANTLRRLMMSEVPTMAIEDLEIKKNNSILYDEMVAHRMGLIPLKTDVGSFDEKSEVTFTLKAKGPGYAYASDMKTKDKKCKPVYPKMPIVKLLKDQDIELEATAVLGVGSKHAKWSPGTIHYVQQPKITINNKSELLKKYKDKYPKAAFDSKGKLSKKKILENNLVDACEGVNKELLKVEYEEENFIFHVESWGQLEPKDIVLSAIEVFDKELTEFAKLVKQ